MHALKNLLPIVTVVLFFQIVIFQTLPPEPISLVFGLLIVAVGIALFLLGLDLSIFPVGKNLANQFARRASLPLLMLFGFAIGFAAVIAEPGISLFDKSGLSVWGSRNSILLMTVFIDLLA